MQEKKLAWSKISKEQALVILEKHKKNGSVLDWEITEQDKGLVNLTITVEVLKPQG